MKQNKIVLALALLGGASQSVWAEDTPAVVELPAVVVTATRSAQNVNTVLNQTTVLNQAQIQQTGAADLPSLLQQYAGVELAPLGGRGALSNVLMRGTNSGHVLVLVDGVRISSASAGTTALQHIPVDEIAKIEIVQGNLSSLYGSDAVGGVIHIFTKKGGEVQRARVQVGVGSHHSAQGNASISGGHGDTRYYLGIGRQYTQGFSATSTPTQLDKDGYRATDINTNLQTKLGERVSLGLAYLRSQSKTAYDNEWSINPQPVTEQVLSSVAADLKVDWTPAWSSQLKLAQGRDAMQDVDGTNRFDSKQNQASLFSTYQQSGWRIAFGGDYLDQRLDSTTAYDEDRRTRGAGFLQAGYSGAGHSVQAGLRRDDDSQFGGFTTGDIRYGWAFTPRWRLSAAIGTAYKAPTFNDLYYPGFSNPDLTVEHSRNQELALRYQTSGQTVQATLFYNQLRDLIAYDYATSKPQNIQEATARGVALEWTGKTPDWQWGLNATWQQAFNENTQVRLLNRAGRFARLNLSRALGPVRLGVEWQLSGHRLNFDPVTYGTSRNAGYGLLNVFVDWKISPAWSANVRIDNLLDKSYQQVLGYNTAGMEAFARVTYSPQW